MPPKPTQDQRAKHATFILDQVVALGIPLTFNIDEVANNLGLSVNGAKGRIREVKKHNPGLRLSFTSSGKSGAGPPEARGEGAAEDGRGSTPATRSGRGRRRREVGDAEPAGVMDDYDEEEVDVDAKVSRVVSKKSKSKASTGDRRCTTRSSSNFAREEASSGNDENFIKEEARQKAPRTRAERRSAGLEDDEQVSLPVHAPKGRHAASGKAAMHVEKEEAEERGEDVSHDPVTDGSGLDEEVVEQDSMDESAVMGNNAFVGRLLEETSTDGPGGAKRKRSIPPQTPSPTFSFGMLESSDLMPPSDLVSTPDSIKEESRAAVSAQGNIRSKPPPAKKAKLGAADAAAVAAVKHVTDDFPEPAAVAETSAAGEVSRDTPDIEEDKTTETSASEEPLSSVPLATPSEEVLDPEDTNQVSHRNLVESIELVTPPSAEKAFARENIMESEQEENAETAREGAENGTANASETTSPVDKPAQMHARERRSQFFTNPLKWMSYSREARPAEPRWAFEVSVDGGGRPYPRPQD